MSRVASPDDVQTLRQSLETTQAQLQAVLDSALDCIICTDDQARITDFNGVAERTFRISPSSARGRDLVDLILPPATREHYRREWFQAPATDDLAVVSNRMETRVVRSDGTQFPAEITVTRVVANTRTTFTVYVRDVSVRRKTEETVVWLAAVVESSQDAIIGKDLTGCITSWNRGAELMYGYSADEAIGKNISILAPPGRDQEISEILSKLRSGRGIEGFETTRCAKSGKLLDVSLTVSPVFDSDESVVGASVIARDISASKRAAEALRKANETSVYASPVPIIRMDTNCRVVLWNPAAEKTFGWSEQEVIGRPNPIVPQSEAESTARLYAQLLSGETVTGVELLRQRRDGTLLNVSMTGSPLWDENHQVKGIIGFLTDVTEKKRAQEDLRQAERKYRSIFNNAVEGIYQTTPAGRYISANPALASMLGFDNQEELITARQDIATQEYVDPKVREEFVRALQEQGVVRNFEYQAYRKDGKVIWVSENAHVVRDPAGEIVYFEGTVEDITRQRELEHQVRQMQKMEAIGHLAGGVAHDFNNILMAISSYSELMRKKTSSDSNLQRYIDEIMRATNRGASLTQGLLAFGRKQVCQPKVTDLNAVISGQSDMLMRLIGESIDLRFTPAESLDRVKVDPSQMEQVVMNLVINARDAMSNGGALLIETENVEFEKDTSIQHDNIAPGKYVTLSVSDNGCGMDAQTKSRLFEPFFTTKGLGKGTGLGLATVFGIVKQSNGHIVVQSEVGRGTTFKVYLPQWDDTLAAREAGAADTELFDGTETILLVEDEDAVRESAAEYLSESGYKVLTARKGSEALWLAEQYKGPIHLLLTDLVMPQMSGRELSEKICASHPEANVVFMSGYANNLLPEADQQYPHLQKPFSFTVLGRCIKAACGKQKAAGAS